MEDTEGNIRTTKSTISYRIEKDNASKSDINRECNSLENYDCAFRDAGNSGENLNEDNEDLFDTYSDDDDIYDQALAPFPAFMPHKQAWKDSKYQKKEVCLESLLRSQNHIQVVCTTVEEILRMAHLVLQQVGLRGTVAFRSVDWQIISEKLGRDPWIYEYIWWNVEECHYERITNTVVIPVSFPPLKFSEENESKTRIFQKSIQIRVQRLLNLLFLAEKFCNISNSIKSNGDILLDFYEFFLRSSHGDVLRNQSNSNLLSLSSIRQDYATCFSFNENLSSINCSPSPGYYSVSDVTNSDKEYMNKQSVNFGSNLDFFMNKHYGFGTLNKGCCDTVVTNSFDSGNKYGPGLSKRFIYPQNMHWNKNSNDTVLSNHEINTDCNRNTAT